MKKSIAIILLVLSIIFVLSCSQGDVGPAGATGENLAILEFQKEVNPSDVYTNVSDAYLDGNTKNGHSNYLFLGRWINGEERILLRFDLTPLTSQKIKVKKAEITLYTYSVSPAGTTMTVTPYELINQWEELEVTWNNRTSALTWTSGGGDYSATPAGSSIKLEKIDTYVTFNISSALVQKWIDNPNSNNGLIFISDTESINDTRYFGFWSSDYSTNVFRRPKLTIYYTLQ